MQRFQIQYVLYPKICPPISSTFPHHKTLGAQGPVRVSSAQNFSLHCCPKLGFVFALRYFDLKCLRWLSCFMMASQVCPYQVSSLDSKFCPVNWNWPRNQLYWGKSQLWPIDSQTSWKLTHINITQLTWIIWSSLDHHSTRNLIRSPKGQNGHF